MDKAIYKELSSGKINENKSLVISECSKGGFTLGQKLTAEDNDKKIFVFLKGAIHIDDIDGLINVRNAFDDAISLLRS